LVYSRRHFGKFAASALPAAFLLSRGKAWAQTEESLPKPDSVFAGVQIGAISYCFRTMPAAEIIPAMTKIGLSEVELMSNHAEALAGAPIPERPSRRGARPRQQKPPRPIPWYTGHFCNGTEETGAQHRQFHPTPEQQAAQAKAQEAITSWRASSDVMEKLRGVKKQFDDAGINLRLLCYNMGPKISDAEIDYAFRMAQTLGVKAISSSSTVSVARRVAPIADKYKIVWGGHGHDNICDPEQFAKPETFEKILSFSPYIGVNLDIGHFTAAGYNSVEFIERYHDRITNLHLKDRTLNPQGGGRGANLPFGDGDTPIIPVLHLMRRHKYPFPANIEYEYQGTDPVVEVAKCLQYCKDALLS